MSENDLDQLLRFSIHRSKLMGYHGYENRARHGRGGYGGDMQSRNHQPNLRIYAMRPPAMRVKGEPLPPPAKKKAVQNKNVNKARNGSNHSTKPSPQTQRERAKPTTKSMKPTTPPPQPNK